MQHKTFTVPNIGCDGCVRTIVNELTALAGVSTVTGDTNTRVVSVEWDAPADWEAIQAKLVEIDYAPAP